LPFKRPESEATTATDRNKPRWLRDQRNSWHGVDFPYHSELDIERYYKRYCETLRSVDDSIGRVLQQLKDMGIHDETLVIYMGDNGFMFGEHGLIDKRVAYETSMRVPMLVQCPNLFIKGGTVVEQMIANIDVGPTVMEAMGTQNPAAHGWRKFPAARRGRDHPVARAVPLRLLLGKELPADPHHLRAAHAEANTSPTTASGTPTSFFDLEADPDESRNLIHDPAHAGPAHGEPALPHDGRTRRHGDPAQPGGRQQRQSACAAAAATRPRISLHRRWWTTPSTPMPQGRSLAPILRNEGKTPEHTLRDEARENLVRFPHG
jgi:N-acetylglucosamine-6-sulfatase